MRGLRHFVAGLASLLFLLPAVCWAQPSDLETPIRLVQSFDRQKLQGFGEGRFAKTLVVVGDRLDISDYTFMPSREPHQRTSDVVLLARELRVGPGAVFLMDGVYTPGSAESTRAGDLYLAADTIVVDGLRNDGAGLAAPLLVHREGAAVSPAANNPFNGRRGRIHVLANRVEYSPGYIQALVKEISGGAVGNTPVPPVILRTIARSFSPGNPASTAAQKNPPLLWSELPGAFDAWIRAEPPSALAARELKLQLSQGDSFKRFVDGIKDLPASAVETWFMKSLQSGTALARSQLLSQNFAAAAASVDSLKSLISQMPPSIMSRPEVAAAIETLLATDKSLQTTYVVDSVSVPRAGAPPLSVTVLRDQASSRILVLPNMLTTVMLHASGGLRVGFADREGNSVRLRFSARLQLDDSVLSAVKARYPNAQDVRLVSNEVQFDTPNLQLNGLTAMNVGQTSPMEFTFDMRIPESGFVAAMAELTQQSGKNVSLGWRHTISGEAKPQAPLVVNLSLLRGDAALVAMDGRLLNPFPNTVEVDYVVDGDRIRPLDSPLRIPAGQSVPLACATSCHAPGPAVRHMVSIDDPFRLLLPATGSAVQTFRIENQLRDDPARGGAVRSVQLTLTFSSANAGIEQKAQQTLGRQGTPSATRTARFIGPPSGTLHVTGRAFWGNGQSYQDLKPRTVQAGIVIVDESWLP